MKIRDMLKKDNRIFTVFEFPPEILIALAKRLLFVLALVGVTVFFAINTDIVGIQTRTMIMLLPILLGLFFLATFLHLYLVAATGAYIAIEGICTESHYPQGITAKIKKKTTNIFAPGIKMTFAMETNEGEVYRVLCSTLKHMPREGATVKLLIVKPNTELITLDTGEIQITNYISIQSVKRIAQKKKQTAPDETILKPGD